MASTSKVCPVRGHRTNDAHRSLPRQRPDQSSRPDLGALPALQVVAIASWNYRRTCPLSRSLQFSDRLRQRLLPWHRVIGRIYVYGVAVAVPIGIYIEYIKYVHTIAPLRLLIATSGFGTLFLLTTGMGFFMVKHRNIQAHRNWMTRSYAVALIFLQTRCVDQIPWLSRMVDWPSKALETHSISDIWMYIAFSIIAAELVLRCEKLIKKRASMKKATAARRKVSIASGMT
jgi:uncharacterized membrane protein